MATGQANRICRETGRKQPESDCFLCGFQQECTRKKNIGTKVKRDVTGSYPDIKGGPHNDDR